MGVTAEEVLISVWDDEKLLEMDSGDGDYGLTVADEKPKEGVKTENNDHINLKVAGQDGSVVPFKIKRHIPLNKLMKAYCECQDSPAQLEMEDEDTIDVFQQQTGSVF
ncbi:small ubiquitin-related modifier 2-like [Trichechus manatus latirostris]|uniref:Small ubiquitin-related modifier 2-like n=1 Tax=Trichechus manatus latirostris TaxID=127582 RepID=A0A2Y9R3P0_TRIMA|nr:small ubiquitin-related modifier 2-like [Trichechus manatus latirostris]